MADKTKAPSVQGEGDYASARKFQAEERAFVADPAKVGRKAREAEAALDGPEGEDLERARRETAARGAPPSPE